MHTDIKKSSLKMEFKVVVPKVPIRGKMQWMGWMDDIQT